MRQTRYQLIADELRQQIVTGRLAGGPRAGGRSASGRSDDAPASTGRLLPSEAELSKSFAASRVTVRRALELLRDEGLVDSRQGLGWFVAADPVRQSLGRLGTIESQLAAEGVGSERRILDFRFTKAPARVREVLGVDTVLRVRRLNLADGEPFAMVTVWCPEERGAELSRADVARSPFYELLGIELGGATQTIGAAAATAHEAEVLGVPPSSPVLRCERITRSMDGAPVLVSEHVFPAHLTEFVVELATAGASIAPSGLRLVE